MMTGTPLTASPTLGAAEPILDLLPDAPARRAGQALNDLNASLHLWRLCWKLGWLDLKLRYRGSILGPFWLTASTGVMVGSMGVIYATLFKMNVRDYLPFLTLSLVIWGFIGGLVGDATTCFTQAAGMIRSMRMPFIVHAIRVVLRNLLVLAHNVVVILAVFAFFRVWPGINAVESLPALLLWLVDGIAACLLLGALGARYRDIGPVVASVMQIIFFITPIIWKPDLITHGRQYLMFNPFYDLIEIVRRPLLGGTPTVMLWSAALGFSLLFCTAASLLFMRVRARLAYWV
ncbi:ABC transporter permease [Lichenicoccus roseus]|uniref:ABC transporter permease n=1 Tax=Lichenicoccus roseus TaxID=2683649 RepID=A0A5R9J7E4_9PROT|nr:ABC transporter permease [Lichenicoccus roseus]